MEKYFKTITALLQNKDMDYLKTIMNETQTWDLIDIFEQFQHEKEVGILFRLLNKEKALEVFERLETDIQEKLILSFTHETSIELISEMAPDDRARLLDELPAKITKKLLNSLSPVEREKTADLLGYPNKTAGRIMTPEYFSLKKYIKVKSAIEKIREISKKQDIETIYSIYITNESRVLEGVLSLKDLLKAPDDITLDKIMNKDFYSVQTNEDQEIVAKFLQDSDFLSVPVLDLEGRLVGIVTVDDAIDILEEETTEDMFEKVGLISLNNQENNRSSKLINGNMIEIWKVRIPFLIITLIGGIMAGLVIETFEETLEAVTAVALFIPVVMDMGGNVGTQSSTIFTRALILGQINLNKFWRHLLKEVSIGLSMGVILGTMAGVIAHFWQGIEGLGIVVALALTITITIATLLGYLVPYVLVKLGFDQAAGSDPIITTIKDISGLMVYFILVRHFLYYLL